ncbi:MAG: NAD(P)H-hydrate dehydratase [Woeseiaceae bacterium]
MNVLPQEVYSVATVREIDRVAIEDHGVPGYTLMTRAGVAAVDQAMSFFPTARRWLIFCGAGNNAGDGYVVARLAAREGIEVSIIAVSDPDSLSGDAATACKDFIAGGGVISHWSGDVVMETDLLVDAMLGSGLMRDVGGDYAAAVDAINTASAPVMALDIPTGLHGDTGTVLGSAVQADLSVTFVGLKQGMFLRDGPDYSGAIRFSGLDIDAACYANATVEYQRIDKNRVGELLPPRSRVSHKGDFGHVLVIGGGPGMPGAVRLCGEGALRAGAGRVSIATDPTHAAVIVKDRPELMARGIAHATDVESVLADVDIVAFGPGLGRSEWAIGLMEFLQADGRPAVWDADALNCLAESPNKADKRIITPHPGEAATLLGVTTAEIQADRRTSVQQLQQKYGGVAVLKGAGTLVSSGTAAPWLSGAGNPGMAAPGMGDVLTGIIAGLLAQGLALQDAATVGVDIHARAGDAAAINGERGLLATDLLNEVRGLVNE